MAELRTLLKPNETIKLYAISVDSHEESREFAKKIAQDGRGEGRDRVVVAKSLPVLREIA
ncbi:MAG: hypothetical protein LC776_19515 [Acidobacteria bacterium]|nr:hypothetical protein [Acidobacteriota bacterium]